MSDTIQHNGYTIIIERDTDTISPRDDYDHAGKMVCWHNRYNLGDAHTWNVDSFHAFKEATQNIYTFPSTSTNTQASRSAPAHLETLGIQAK